MTFVPPPPGKDPITIDGRELTRVQLVTLIDMSLNLAVDPDTTIPRPMAEAVAEALFQIRDWEKRN
jgi:hypothetical protein